MNTKSILSALFMYISISASASVFTQSDSLGLPGDNLDLYGVLELFKKSENPEEFEKTLNKEDNKLNNLDLNGDGEIDYIRVIDQNEKNAHTLVLQVPINETEAQDVAVIEIEKNADGSAHLQIVGDEDLYGKDYIIEPASETAKTADQPATAKSTTPVIVNVWGWPSVRYIYQPSYVVWVSPWRWRAYPVWWKPWKPVHYGVYHPHWYGHHGYHRRVHSHNLVIAHNMYYGHRVVSKKVVYQKRNPTPAKQAGQPHRKSSNKMNKEQKVRKNEGSKGNKGGRQKQSGGNKGGRRK